MSPVDNQHSDIHSTRRDRRCSNQWHSDIPLERNSSNLIDGENRRERIELTLFVKIHEQRRGILKDEHRCSQEENRADTYRWLMRIIDAEKWQNCADGGVMLKKCFFKLFHRCSHWFTYSRIDFHFDECLSKRGSIHVQPNILNPWTWKGSPSFQTRLFFSVPLTSTKTFTLVIREDRFKREIVDIRQILSHRVIGPSRSSIVDRLIENEEEEEFKQQIRSIYLDIDRISNVPSILHRNILQLRPCLQVFEESLEEKNFDAGRLRTSSLTR